MLTPAPTLVLILLRWAGAYTSIIKYACAYFVQGTHTYLYSGCAQLFLVWLMNKDGKVTDLVLGVWTGGGPFQPQQPWAEVPLPE